jgi:Tfp pilus assembly protein PilF
MNVSPNAVAPFRWCSTALLVSVVLVVGLAAKADATPPAPANSVDANGRLLPILQLAPHDPAARNATEPTPEPPADDSGDAQPTPVATDAPPVERNLYAGSRSIEILLATDLLPVADHRGVAPRAVVLFISGNRGRTWVRAQKRALPTQAMQFRATNDGEFWCLVRGEPIDARGPTPEALAVPQRIVTVDTEPPVFREVSATAPTAEGRVEVTWLAEDRLPPKWVKAVAVHVADGTVALPADGVRSNQGQATFKLTQPGTWQVGVQISDRAGNVATGRCQIDIAAPRQSEPTVAATEAVEAPKAIESPAVAPGQQIEPAGEVRSRAKIAVLASRSLDIGYRWDTEHPPTRVGLWVTHDGGRTWWLEHVHTELTGTFRFDAEADGVYGFRTHRELGSKAWNAPKAGTAPLREVIIDTVPPVIRWTGPLGPAASDGSTRLPARVEGVALLRWKTLEANAAEKPVTLEYRCFGREPWQAIAGPIDDTGRYDWKIAGIAAGSAELRLTVRDRAGHIATASLLVTLAPSADARATPPEVGKKDRNEARRAYAMATVARLQDNWEAAEKQLVRATSSDPTYTRAWIDLGGVHLHNERWAAASDVYAKALKLAPDSQNAAFGLAKASAAQGDLEGAAKTLDTLLQKAPENADGWRLYGDVLYSSGDRKKARQCWLKALGLGGGQQGNLAALKQRLELKHE